MLEQEELCRKKRIQQVTAEKARNSIQDFGKNNRFVLIHEDGREEYNPQIEGLTVIFYGNDNRVELHAPIKFINCRFKLGDRAEIVIQKTRYNICDVFVDAPMKPGNKLIIGENFSCGHTVFYLGEDPGVCIKIGNDCMFSVQNFFRPGDGHKITQQGQTEQINVPKDIVLGNHVWLGMRNMILKGTVIPDNCVIATSSVVNKVFTAKNCIIGGGTRQGFKAWRGMAQVGERLFLPFGIS